MDKKEILAFISKHNIGYLATVEGKAARVRAMDTFRADENGIIFYTDKAKNVCKQILKTPEIEVCYFAEGLQVRVRGKAVLDENITLKKEIVKARPFYGEMTDGDYKAMAVFRLKGKATTWTMESGDGIYNWVDL